MKSKFLLLIFIIIISNGFSQINENIGEIVKNCQKSSISFEIIDSSLNLNTSKPFLLGSGFLVLKKNRTFAITNAHIKDAVKDNKRLIIGINTALGKVYGLVYFLFEDKGKDIAIFEFKGNVFSGFARPDSLKWDQMNIGISFFAKPEEIIPGNSTISIGYPLSLGSSNFANSPIVRSGMVAQKIQNNGFFLIDGMSNSGNSGSPVFDIIQSKLIGMISSGPEDRINAFDQNGNLIASFPYNSGLTYCISADEILKMLP